MNFGSKIVFVIVLICYTLLIGFGVAYAFQENNLGSGELFMINAHRQKNKTERPSRRRWKYFRSSN